VKSVEKNRKHGKERVENRGNPGERAAATSGVRIETETRAFRGHRKTRTRGDWDTWWA
jgi:hypothetical protein